MNFIYLGAMILNEQVNIMGRLIMMLPMLQDHHTVPKIQIV